MANCGGMQWGRQSHSLKILKNFEIAALGVGTHLLFWLAHFLGKQPVLYVCGCFITCCIDAMLDLLAWRGRREVAVHIC